MKILYLDTSSSFLYAGIVDNRQLVASIKKDFGKDLSTYTLNEIKKLFNKANISLNEIDKIITVNGPGSFTGIRIGLTIAKTLAWSLNKEITTISSLEAMAVSSSNFDYCIPLIDARRGYVYAGIYDNEYNQILENQYIKLDNLLTNINKLTGNIIIVTNDTFNLDLNLKKYDPDILKIVNKFQTAPTVNPHGIDANYLKLTEAEENKKQCTT